MKDLDKPRNFVKKHMDEYCKPSRHRDRKHDYVRREKHKPRESQDPEVLEYRKRRELEKYSPEGADWSGDPDWELDSSDGLEPDEDSPTTS